MPFPAPLSHKDGRLVAFPLPQGWADDFLRLDKEGKGSLSVPLGEGGLAVVQPLLLDAKGGAPLAVGRAVEVVIPR
jgi:hypothetical protein